MITFWVALAGGTIARIPALMIQAKRTKHKYFKMLFLTIAMTFFELLGTLLLFWLENGEFGGTSYYGGILLMPIFCLCMAPLFKIPYQDITDMFGASAGGMLAIMRLQCAYHGCCSGRTIALPSGYEFVFPSPIVELVTVLILMVIVVSIGKQPKMRGKLFPIYLILYGATRFILNGFRSDLIPFVWILPAGHFWSLVAILIGVFWLLILGNQRLSSTRVSATP